MLIRKLVVCSGLTLCALAINTVSAQNYQGRPDPGQWGYGSGVPQMPPGAPQNYQGWPDPGQWGYGQSVPQGMPQMPQGMPQMPQMPQGMPQMPPGMPQMPPGAPQNYQGWPDPGQWGYGQSVPQGMPQAGPMQQYGSGGFQRQQAAPYQNPWADKSMPYAPGYQGGARQTGMSGMQGQRGMSGMSGMSGMQGQRSSYEAPFGQFPGRYERGPQGGGYVYPSR